LNLPQGVVKAQLKKAGISKKMTYLRELQWTLKVRQWIDPNTAILYASLRERAERGSDLDREDLGYFGADFLFTLKFDDNGNWKIVKTHRMSGKGEESQSTSVPLAEEVAYQSPKGSYRIQASADGTALWIVPTNDPARRKVLPDADPDNRLASEFSSSPDEKWLYDDRQSELYRDIGELSFAALNKKEWMRRATARLRRRLRKCLRPWSISNPKPIAHRIKRDAREPTARAGGYFIVPLHGSQYDPQLRKINALPRFEDKKAPPKRTSFLI